MDKKELKKEYKRTLQPTVIYQIKNLVTSTRLSLPVPHCGSYTMTEKQLSFMMPSKRYSTSRVKLLHI